MNKITDLQIKQFLWYKLAESILKELKGYNPCYYGSGREPILPDA